MSHPNNQMGFHGHEQQGNQSTNPFSSFKHPSQPQNESTQQQRNANPFNSFNQPSEPQQNNPFSGFNEKIEARFWLTSKILNIFLLMSVINESSKFFKKQSYNIILY